MAAKHPLGERLWVGSSGLQPEDPSFDPHTDANATGRGNERKLSAETVSKLAITYSRALHLTYPPFSLAFTHLSGSTKKIECLGFLF